MGTSPKTSDRQKVREKYRERPNCSPTRRRTHPRANRNQGRGACKFIGKHPMKPGTKSPKIIPKHGQSPPPPHRRKHPSANRNRRGGIDPYHWKKPMKPGIKKVPENYQNASRTYPGCCFHSVLGRCLPLSRLSGSRLVLAAALAAFSMARTRSSRPRILSAAVLPSTLTSGRVVAG
jgi:hypothetical protein